MIKLNINSASQRGLIMIEISKIASSIPESPTIKLNAEAARLRAQGEPIVHLGVGEPKNKAPESAIQSAMEKLKSGEIKYVQTDGMPSLKKAIAQYTEKNYRRVVDTANIIVSDGAKHSLFNLLYALINPGDEVIVFSPYWVSYPEMVRMFNGVPVIVSPSDGSFHPKFTDVEKAVTNRTKAIIVNSPNNPSGAVFSDELISEIVDLCEKKDICLIMDDIYHKLVFDGREITPVYEFTKKDIESTNVIVVNGISKTYGMTGFRIGWVIANKKIVKAMTNIQSQSTTCSSPVCQMAAEGALNGDQKCVDELVNTIQRNRDLVVRELSTIPGVKVTKPEGTFYCLPDFSAINKDSMALAELLLKKALVITVPGKDFGAEGHLRISYATAYEEVLDGLTRIKWALIANSPKEIQVGNRRLIKDW